MIRYIKRSDLDEIKYNACIAISVNARIYAYSWYLDCAADNWDVLVLNNYDAVMPLPWRSKYFIKYVYPPSWTQQLGVFSSNEINNKLIQQFINSIPRKFKKVTVQFNSGNPIAEKNVTERVNYVLGLNRPYEELLKGFNKNRRRTLKNLISSKFIIEKDIKPKEFLEFYLETEKDYELKTDQTSSLERLLAFKTKNINIWGVSVNGKLISGLVWLNDESRVTFLLPISRVKAKKLGIPTLIVAELINQFSNTNLTLDFEGSMIDGVARFYKSFGAERETYYLYQKV